MTLILFIPKYIIELEMRILWLEAQCFYTPMLRCIMKVECVYREPYTQTFR